MLKRLFSFIFTIISFVSFGQVEIAREAFDNTANLSTTTGGFCGSDNSGACSTTLNIWNIDGCTTWSGSGGTQSFFMAQDFDACGSSTNPHELVVDLGTIAAGNTGEVTLEMMFGARTGSGPGYDSNDSVRIKVSVDGGTTYPDKLLIQKSGGTNLEITDGSTTDPLSTTFTKRTLTLGSGLNGQNIRVKLIYHNLISGSESAAIDEFVLLHCASGDNESVIEENSFNEPDNIDYATYSAASGLTTANSIKIGEFVIKDGGADLTDADAVSTVLGDISFTVSGAANIAAMALFDGVSNLAEATTVLGTTTFSGLSITAGDNSSKSFDVYATFKSTVTDNEQIQLTISSVTHDCSSGFAAADGGGASTSIAGDDNRIEVTATKLIVTAPSWWDVNTDMTLTAAAADANNNTDLDNTTSVTLSEGGAGTMSSATGLTQSLVNGMYSWSDIQHDTEETITITASDGSLTDGTADVDFNSPTTYYVNDNSLTGDVFTSAVGINSNSGTATNAPFLTLTHTLTVAGAGDIIYVDAGTYSDIDQTVSVNRLRIIGAGMNLTIFDNNQSSPGNNRFLRITSDEVVVKELRVQEYNDATIGQGHALWIDGGDDIEITNVQFDDNGYTAGEGVIAIYSNSSATFSGGGSTCNDGFTVGGGFHIDGTNINVTIQNYVLYSNEVSAGTDGAGLRMTGGNATQQVILRNVLFEANTSQNEGGAIAMNDGDLKVYDCKINNNTGGEVVSSHYGAAVSIYGGTAYFTRTQFTNSSEITAAATTMGGAIGVNATVNDVVLTVDSCSFSGNSSDEGADIHCAESVSDDATVTVFNSTFSSAGTNLYNDDGVITISNSGDPAVSGTVTKTNTTAPSYTANPTVGDFSGTCATNVTILPIELLSFYAIKNKENVDLNWVTTTEKNNAYFTLERSSDGRIFEEIAKIEGAGNSNKTIDYHQTDFSPFEGISYYRLKQTDFDGNSSYSTIRKVNFSNNIQENIFELYPNPVRFNSPIYINTNAEYMDIITTSGRVVQRQKSLSKLYIEYPGIYIVKAIYKNGETSISKVVVSR